MAIPQTPRRYYHRKRMNARFNGDVELEGAWRALQEQQLPSTALPASFPYRAELAAEGYAVREDLDGADVEELMGVAKFTKREAEEVLAALTLLQ